MGRLNLSELEPGMILALPVFDDRGILLLPSRIRLTEGHLKQLKRWDVHEAVVEAVGRDDLAADAEAQIDPALLAAIDNALDEKFATTDGDEIMDEVKRIARKMTIDEATGRRTKARRR
jgi:hypothetical protein